MKQLSICFIYILGLDLCLTSQPKIAPWLDYSLLFKAIILQLKQRDQTSLIHLMSSFYTHTASKSHLEQLKIFLKALQMSSRTQISPVKLGRTEGTQNKLLPNQSSLFVNQWPAPYPPPP